MRNIVSPLDGFLSPFGRLLSGGALSAYAVSGLEPPLVLDFIEDYYRTGGSASTFDDALNFSRAGAATYTDADGVLQTADAGVPRVGNHVYNGSEWVNEGLLLESEARTNLITYSQDFTDAYWDKFTRTSISPDDQIAPDGALTGDKANCIETNANGFFVRINANTNIPENGIITVSCFFKQGSRSQALITVLDGAQTNGVRATFDLSTGSFVTSSTVGSGWSVVGTPSITSASNGWYKCSVVVQASGSAARLVLYPSIDSISDFSCTSGVDFGYLWGAQLEAGSTPSSYIPTNGSTVTRAAEGLSGDTLSYDDAAMWFTLSGLETYADESSAGQVELFDWRSDADNRITVTLDTDGAETGEITLTVVSGGTSWSVAKDYLSPDINVPFSIAWRVTDAEINIATGGDSHIAVSTASIPNLSSATAVFSGMGSRAMFRQGVGDIGDAGIEEGSQ